MYRNYTFASFLVLTVLFLFYGTKEFDFTWDDKVNIVNNSHLSGAGFKSFLRFWETPYENLYIPVTYSLWFALASLSSQFPEAPLFVGPSPVVYHAANLIVHLINVLLVYMVLGCVMSGGQGEGEGEEKISTAAAVGAFLFAAHPMQVEAVSWATGMKDLLSACFSLIAILLFLKFVTQDQFPSGAKRGSPPKAARGFNSPYYLLATMAFLLALLSKPNAVVLPLLAFLLALLVGGTNSSKKMKYLLPWLLLVLPFISITKNLQPDSSFSYVLPIFLRPIVALDAVTFYLFKLLFPFNLAMDYGRTPEYVMAQIPFYITSFFSVTLIWFFFRGVKTKLYLYCLLIFITGILPVSGLIPFAFQFFSTVADRYAYFSMLGPSLAVSFFLARQTGGYSVSVCLALIFLCFTLLTHEQKNSWQNDRALFDHAARVNSRSSLVRYNLGVTFSGLRDFENAEKSFLDAMRLQPEFPDAVNSLGEVYLKLGKLKKAEDLFVDLLQKVPEFEKALNNMGIVQRGLGKNDQAITFFKKAISVKPDYAKAHNNLGVQLALAGDTDEAIYHFKRALRYKPGYLNAENNLDLILFRTGQEQ